jgi:hypothetical protein
MSKQPESRLQKRIQDALRRQFGGWWFKVWGGPFTPAGIPDLIGCVDGMFFALEVKLPKKASKPSLIQLETIRDIVFKGGGVATIVRSEEEAINVVTEALAKAASRLQLRHLTRRRSTVWRTANRKDLYHLGHPTKDGGRPDKLRDRGRQ